MQGVSESSYDCHQCHLFQLKCPILGGREGEGKGETEREGEGEGEEEGEGGGEGESPG